MALFILPPLIVISMLQPVSHTFSALFCFACFASMSLLISGPITSQKENSAGFNPSNWSQAQHTVIMSSSKTPQSPISAPSTLTATNQLENNVLVSAGKRKKYKGRGSDRRFVFFFFFLLTQSITPAFRAHLHPPVLPPPRASPALEDNR